MKEGREGRIMDGFFSPSHKDNATAAASASIVHSLSRSKMRRYDCLAIKTRGVRNAGRGGGTSILSMVALLLLSLNAATRRVFQTSFEALFLGQVFRQLVAGSCACCNTTTLHNGVTLGGRVPPVALNNAASV